MKVDREKLQAMLNASLESIAYRQDKYPTGGIVESDDRFDNGFLYGGGKACYPRTALAEPLPYFGMEDRLRKMIAFWKVCQDQDGSWGGSFQVDEPRPYTGPNRDRHKAQTDTTGYVLRQCGAYFRHSRDTEWLKNNWEMIDKGAEYLISILDGQYNMIPGREEAIVREESGEVDSPKGYHVQINAVCEKGLRDASELALGIGHETKAGRFTSHADKIKKGMEKHLWDEAENRYLWGMDTQGKPFRGAMWFSLMPWYVNRVWDERASSTFWYLWERFYDKDPLIPRSYWSNDYTDLLEGKYSFHTKYSGAGPWIGVSAAIAQMLIWESREDLAAEQINLITQYTDDSNLICEHINTIHPGSEGRFKIYPEEPYAVDRGNLMHLSFFLNLAMELCDKGIIQARNDL